MLLCEIKLRDRENCVKNLNFWEQRKRTLLREKYLAVSFTLCDWNFVEKRQALAQAELELLDQLIDNCLQLLKLYE